MSFHPPEDSPRADGQPEQDPPATGIDPEPAAPAVPADPPVPLDPPGPLDNPVPLDTPVPLAPAVPVGGATGDAGAGQRTEDVVAVDPPPSAEIDDVRGLRDADFPLSLRGYNTHAVDRYVHRVERCIAQFEEHRLPTEAVRRALDRVGEQTSAILREAERSAEETTRASRAKADDRLQRAEREAAELWAAAQERARQLDEEVERLWQERQRLIDATRQLANRLHGTADEAEAVFPPEDAPDEPGGSPAQLRPRPRPAP